jgi:hypothetical protein
MFTRKSLVVVLVLAALLMALTPLSAGARSSNPAPLFQSPVATPGPLPYASLIISGITTGVGAAGGQFTTDVTGSIDSNGLVNSVELYLAFSPQVTPADADSVATGIQPAVYPVGFFSHPTVTANEVLTPCPIGGYTSCVHLIVADLTIPQVTNKTGVIARLYWKGVSGPQATFTIINPYTILAQPARPRTELTFGEGFPVALYNATTTPVDIAPAQNINGAVRRQGVPPSIGPGTLACTQITVTTGSTVVATAIVTDTLNGSFSIAAPPAGTYSVQGKYPGYLMAQINNVQNPANIGTSKLYGGDANMDGVINILDISLMTNSANWGTTGHLVGSAGGVCSADDAVDINDDGVVNISDLAIAAGNFGKVAPTIWAP